MYLTTPSAVRGITEVDPAFEDDDLLPFIETADSMVNYWSDSAKNSDAQMELIARWLSAHFYRVRDLQTRHEQADEVQESYFGRVGFDLRMTHYGQQAMALDFSGGLSRWNKQLLNGTAGFTPTVTWLGLDE
jgi:hypothetical protein